MPDDERADDTHAQLTRLFGIADACIDAHLDVFPAAVWLRDDGSVAKSPLTRNGHLDAHRDRQLIRQQLIDPPHKPLGVPDDAETVVACVPGSAWRIVLDCDVKHGKAGKQALDDLRAEYGDAWIKSAWRTPSGGVNILCETAIGDSFGNTSPWPGIDVRGNSGWVVAPGNVCAAGAWEWKVGNFTTAFLLPGAMADQLSAAVTTHGPKASNAETRTFVDEHSGIPTTVPAMQWFDGALTRFRSSRIGSRHDALRTILGAVCGMNTKGEALDVRWAIERIKVEWQALTAGEGREDEVTDLLTWTVGQELRQRAQTNGAAAPSVPAAPIANYHNLPDEFWQRPLLAAIRAWAHAHHRSADAVYACVRARFAITVPWTLRVDTGIATPVVLNLLTAIVADSGVGKSSAMALAEEVLDITNPETFIGPLGSGEGITEAFYDEVVVMNAQGKNEKVRQRTRNAALFDLDEGEALMRLGGRQGSLLLPELRKAYSGRALGQSNASITTRRSLAANSYRLGLLMGLQPEAALVVIGDTGTGTSQRVMLFSGADPTIPEQVTTAPMPVLPPPPAGAGLPSTAAAHLMTFVPEVLAEIQAHDLAVQRGQVKVPILDSHRPANRIKEAALLAMLDGRAKQINAEDWALAGMVLDTSDALRAAIVATKAAAEHQAAVARGARDAVVEGAKEHKLVAQLAERVLARLKGGPAEGIAPNDLRKATTSASTKRRFGPAVDGLVADGKIVLEGGRLKVRK